MKKTAKLLEETVIRVDSKILKAGAKKERGLN